MPVPGTTAAPAPYDPEAPSIARMWNYWLGGTDYGEADRRQAAATEEACPAVRRMARNARLFSARAVTYAAGDRPRPGTGPEPGTGQFLELGCGLAPAEASVHAVARAVRPGAAVAYADSDPAVTDDLDALLDGGRDGLAVVNADLRDPGAVLAAAREVIDPAEPVCVLLVSVLQVLGPGEAAEAVAGWAEAVAPGSFIAVSVPAVADELTVQRLGRLYAAAAGPGVPPVRYDFTCAEVGGWLAGLEIVPPGVVPAASLRPGWAAVPRCPPGPEFALAAIGRKPR